MSTIDSANPPQEYPDMVGARPTNPFAASFKPFIPASAHSAELTWPQLITGTILGNLRRVVALSCAQSRIDGERADTGGRAFNHNLSRCVESSRRPRSIAREPRESSVNRGRPAHGPQGNGSRARRLHGNFRAALRRGGLSIRISPLAKLGARSRPRRLPLHQARQRADPRFLD